VGACGPKGRGGIETVAHLQEGKEGWEALDLGRACEGGMRPAGWWEGRRRRRSEWKRGGEKVDWPGPKGEWGGH